MLVHLLIKAYFFQTVHPYLTNAASTVGRFQFSDWIQNRKHIVTRSVENFVENMIYRNSPELLASFRELASTQSTRPLFSLRDIIWHFLTV